MNIIVAEDVQDARGQTKIASTPCGVTSLCYSLRRPQVAFDVDLDSYLIRAGILKALAYAGDKTIFLPSERLVCLPMIT
jgi:hypothetical protein